MKRWSVLLALSAATAPANVLDYVAAPDASFAWQPGPSGPGYANLALTSQTWQGLPWRHTVTLYRPPTVLRDDLAVLVITGGRYRPGTDATLYALLASQMKLPVAVLWDIPNQPLFANLFEDALIAHTFVRFMETGDATWPLLFPMTKAAVRAMDALQAFSAQNGGKRIARFVVTGASKRGWTTWFAGAVDPRVAAIMPMVYDNLNLAAQMRHQMATWGAYSPMIADYTKLDLPNLLQTEAGRKLGELVDPYTYRDRLTLPKLIVCGTNDRYWTVDALNLYRDDLRGETCQLYVPNSGHGLPDQGRVLATASAFTELVATGTPRPQLAWRHGGADGRATLTVTAPTATKVVLWSAAAAEGKFYAARWTPSDASRDGDIWTGSVPIPPGQQVALFAEATFDQPRAWTLSTALAVR